MISSPRIVITFPYCYTDHSLSPSAPHSRHRHKAHTLPLAQNSVKWKIDVPPARGRSVCFVCIPPQFPRVWSGFSAASSTPHQVNSFTKAASLKVRAVNVAKYICHENEVSLFRAPKCATFEVSHRRAEGIGSSAGVPFTYLHVDIAFIGAVIQPMLPFFDPSPNTVFISSCVFHEQSHECSVDIWIHSHNAFGLLATVFVAFEALNLFNAFVPLMSMTMANSHFLVYFHTICDIQHHDK